MAIERVHIPMVIRLYLKTIWSRFSPIDSKWWWIGAAWKTLRLKIFLELTWIIFPKVVAISVIPAIGRR